MKKVLIFSLAYYPRVGGAEVAIKELTDRIPDIEFHMVTMRFSPTDKKEERVGNMFVHRVGSGGSYLDKILFVPRAALIARALHKKEKFDACWAMMSYMLFPLVLANLKVPYALTLQEGDTEQHMFGRLRIVPFLPLLSWGFRRATVVQAISTYLGGWARKRGCKGPLEIIPNGVDVRKFSGAPTAHGGVVLIHTGRLVHKNAVDDIICALKLLPQEIRLRLVGIGPDEPALHALAKRLGVDARVEFMGFVDQAQLPALLHAADIFIRPSRSEGMGNSFIEAFAAGLPVIATQEGGLKDFVTPEVAWPVEKDSPLQIAAAVEAIVRNPRNTARVVESAKQLAAQKYDWDLLARAMREKVFARLFV